VTRKELRYLPSVDAVKRFRQVEEITGSYPDPLVTLAVRRVIDRLRKHLEATSEMDLPVENGKLGAAYAASEVQRELTAILSPSLVPVINATGVVIHTNLGRAPMGPETFEAMRAIATGYSNLEYLVGEGRRGSRHQHFESVLKMLIGAESCMVVNNNAAAVLLVLTALARGREVVVSRGELIEIGGSFRLPDVMAQGGAILREVGATNKTHLGDYEGAVNERTGLLLKAHRSNFEIRGFTQEVSRAELADLAERTGVPFVEDLGSGLMCDLSAAGVDPANQVARTIAEGVHLVTFSGDKMLGGPQAGIIAGRKDLVDRLKRHPLTRALRPDKLTFAALEAVALAFLRDAASEIPVVSMLRESEDETAARAEIVADGLRNVPSVTATVVRCRAKVGGGAEPERTIASAGVRIAREGTSENAFEAALRRTSPPVIARIEGGCVLLDLKTVRDFEVEQLVTCVRSTVGLLSDPNS
jgi:L-seryl-tRNA(Ser) seleniumtransferase